MKAEMKVIATVNSKRDPLLVVKIRTEHELLISNSTFDTVRKAINAISEGELQRIDNDHFVWELRELMEVFWQYKESPQTVIGRLESDWKAVNGALTLDTLKSLDQSTKNNKSMRIEGSVENNLRLIIQSGVDVKEIPATRDNLQSLRSEVEMAKEEPEYKASAAIAEWLVAIALLIEAALSIWDRWDKEQEKRREKEERERRDEKKQREAAERNVREPRESISDGGPAHDGLIDRIGRTC